MAFGLLRNASRLVMYSDLAIAASCKAPRAPGMSVIPSNELRATIRAPQISMRNALDRVELDALKLASEGIHHTGLENPGWEYEINSSANRTKNKLQ